MQLARVDLVEELAEHKHVKHHGVVRRGCVGPVGAVLQAHPHVEPVLDQEQHGDLVQGVHHDEPPHAARHQRLVTAIGLAVQQRVYRSLCASGSLNGRGGRVSVVLDVSVQRGCLLSPQ